MWTPSPETLNTDFSAIKAKKDADYQNNQSIWNTFWVRCNQNVRLETGDPTIMNVWGNNPATIGSSNYYFNRARPIGLMLSGYQRRNRKSTVVQPLENGDVQTADQYTKLLLNLYKKENVYEIISEAFHEGSIISGMNLIQVYLDFTNDPLNGDIKFRNLAYSEFMIDPYFRDPSLSDAEFIIVRSYMSKPAIAAIMPERYWDEIMSLPDNPQGSTIDGRFQYQAAARGYSMAPKLAYDEYYYRDYRLQEKIYDAITGEMMDITNREDLDLVTLLDENPQLRIGKKRIPTVRMAITIQDRVFYDGPNNMGLDCMPFIPMIGFHNRSLPYMYNRIQSVMTSLLSPQILFNRRIILNADFLESVVNTGYMFKQSAVLDPKHLLQTGQGRLIPLKDSATPLADVVPIPAPDVPPSAFTQLEVYDKELFNVVGLSQENLGKVVEDDSSGYQSALRTAAGLTAQQPLFDRLDLSQNLLGNLVMQVIQNNYTPGKVKQLLAGEEPAPLFYDKAFGKYHCVVENGYNTETQKQLEFAQKLQLKQAGINFTDAQMLDSASLQHKDRYIAELQQQAQQQQQMQQMQMQIQLEEIKARADLARATAYSQTASGNERNSRTEENRALAIRQIHEANRDDSAATLDRVRTIKELEGMDIAVLEKLVGLVNLLKAGETAQANQEEVSVQNRNVSQEAPQGAGL